MTNLNGPPKDERPPERGKPGPTPETGPHQNANYQHFSNWSQQVSWSDVHEFVAARIGVVGDFPMAGTPAWCSLADSDPRKLAALFDAAQHWVLRVETCQVAECGASHDVSAATDWSEVARSWRRHVNAHANPAHIPRAA